MGKDYLDLEQATVELSRRGYFTIEALQEAFRILTEEGDLRPPVGKIKQLTEQEELRVIADIASKGPAAAVIHSDPL
jgi:hypothetical protein